MKQSAILWFCTLWLHIVTYECFVLPSGAVASLPNLATPFDSGERCFGSLGCYARFPPDGKWARLADAFQVGFYPDPPDQMNVYFYVYSCASRYRATVLPWNVTEAELQQTSFDPDKLTVFIVHGFRDNYDDMNWMGDLKDFILNVQNRINEDEEHCDRNVIGVDWRGGSQVPLYIQAVANTQIVGAIIARFIRRLIRLGDSGQTGPEHFSLVGHSLGAHVAGFAGAHFRGDSKLRTIIGLDPAGPAFDDIPNSHRLDPSDARLVITIHTNGGPVVNENFGIASPLGHYSFYPNGGSQQPGCEKTRTITNILLDGLVNGLTDSVACNHRRATQMVALNESLFSTAQSMAYACRSYYDFERGQCGTCVGRNSDRCKPFGGWFTWWQHQTVSLDWHKPIRYFIDTTDSTSVSLFHFQVTVRTKSHFAPLPDTWLQLIPIGTLRNGRQLNINFGTVRSNFTYTHLMKVPKDLGSINMALIKVKQRLGSGWERAFNLDQERSLNPDTLVRDVRINFMSHHSDLVRKRRSSRLVASHNQTELIANRDLGRVFVAVADDYS